MDDESGWNEILVDGWGPLVRAAAADRVEEAFRTARGVLASTVVAPDDAPPAHVELVHGEVLDAIRVETGAQLDELGSQAAWATYEDVWDELARRWRTGGDLEPVRPSTDAEVVGLLAGLPPAAVRHAGAVRDDDGTVRLAVLDGAPRVDVEGLFRWLATDEVADATTRDRARAVVAAVRRGDRPA